AIPGTGSELPLAVLIDTCSKRRVAKPQAWTLASNPAQAESAPSGAGKNLFYFFDFAVKILI
ncbi:MAG: hypothetical protein LBK13_08185, partial [Spirochaetales bacterium]|nr:hypothetical protein [Spirochaetales bacterium]